MKNFIKGISEADRLRALKYVKVGTNIAYALFRYALLISIGFIIIYPLLYMIVTSIMSPTAISNATRVWIPSDISMYYIKDNFYKAFVALDYLTSFISTIKYEIVSALIEVVSCAIIGYGFARFNFKGKKILTGILFLTILIPDMMVMMPRMVNYANLDFLYILTGVEKVAGLFGSLLSKIFGEGVLKFFTWNLTPNIVNTGWTLWLPSLLGIGLRSGVLIYIYIQFFTGLPRELEEAAWVDGAGPIKTFLRIAVPSSSVVFITVTVFSVVWHWNDSLLSGLYFTDKRPLAPSLVGAKEFLGAAWGLYGGRNTPQQASVMMAICIIYILPVLIFYMIVQRGFVESIDRVGITG